MAAEPSVAKKLLRRTARCANSDHPFEPYSITLIGAGEQRTSFSELFLPPLTYLLAFENRRLRAEPNAMKETLMTTASTLDSKETVSLIGSDKVEGTAVYGADEKKIGKLERVMIDKISGKVAHGVLSFGGFMGMGEDYYPVPWSMLKYDTNLGGYRVKLTKDQLDKAPKYSKSTDWNWNRDNDRRVYDYYKAPPYWG